MLNVFTQIYTIKRNGLEATVSLSAGFTDNCYFTNAW